MHFFRRQLYLHIFKYYSTSLCRVNNKSIPNILFFILLYVYIHCSEKLLSESIMKVNIDIERVKETPVVSILLLSKVSSIKRMAM